MVSWSSRRKALTILLFVFPTLLGILVFNVYPIILNTYVSITNRNKFHPYPDCAVGLNGVLDPVCWPVFRDRAPAGLGDPYTIQQPFYANYADLIGKLFTPTALLALLSLALLVVPFAAVGVLDRRFEKLPTRPVPSLVLWIGAIVAAVVIAILFNAQANWDTLMASGDFIVVVMRTLLFVLIRVPLSFVLGLTLALILNSNFLPGRTFFRVLLFIPWAASSLAILMALVWQFFFREQGTINQVLSALFNIKGLSWLSNPTTAFAAIVAADTWFSYPFFMIVILGALQSVPADTYEAASIDGATWWQQLTGITLPLIRPVILPAIVLTSITAFQMFGTGWAMTAGGPVKGAGQPGATEFVMIYAFKQIFQTQNYGRATAFAVILFIFLFGATLYSLRLTRITKGALE